MKKIILLLCFLLSAARVRAESSVWVVSTPTSTVYLAGSCHVLRPGDYPLPREFDAAYARAGTVLFEAPMDELTAPRTMLRLMTLGIYQDGSRLREHVDAAAWARLADFCKSRNYSLAQFESVRPWMAILQLSVWEMMRLGVQPDLGMDRHYWRRVQQDGKATGGLESAEQQVAFLGRLDRQLSNEMIFQSLAELEGTATNVVNLLTAWRAGDEREVGRVLNREMAEKYPQVYQSLICERNRNWLPEVERRLRQPGRVMIIVGVGHLVGPDGIPAQLAKRGYAVRKFEAAR